MTKSTHTLIIGGGFAGATAAKELEHSGVPVTLVDRKDYFEVTIATLRNLADFESIKDKPRARYADFIQGEFIQAGVSELTPTEAILDNGDVITFQRAIIATGSSYGSFPVAKSTDALTYEARHQELKEAAGQLAQASSVLVIGAGAVGVELAGEIAFKHPHLTVTLAEAGPVILSPYSDKARRKATEQLKALGVSIETNRLYQAQADRYVDSNTGDTLRPDLTYVAVGVKPNSTFMRTQLANTLTDKGFIKVDSFFKVEGTQNLYAIGDVADLPDMKLAAAAMPQAKKLIANLLADENGKKAQPHKPMPAMGMFPIGQDKGVAQLPFGTVTWKFLVDMKNKDLFISRTLKSVGVE